VIDFKSLVISVPASQLPRGTFLGSIFNVDELYRLSLPRDLTLAVRLIQAHYAGASPLRCVVRPEMFTHGKPLAWLLEKLAGATDHLHLSDGTTLKLIPGLKNHLFVYGVQSESRRTALARLLRQAPELLGQFQSQINMVLPPAGAGSIANLETKVLMPKEPASATRIWYYGLYINPHSVIDSVDQMLSWGELDCKALPEFSQVTYLPLTSSARADLAYQRIVCGAIHETYFNSTQALFLRIPMHAGTVRERISEVLEALRRAGLRCPRSKAVNIFLAADDVPEATLGAPGNRLQFFLHQSFEYWRYTKGLYSGAGKVTLCAHQEHEPDDAMQRSFVSAFGQEPTLQWLERPADEAVWSAIP
jgi:hypothetical protein